MIVPHCMLDVIAACFNSCVVRSGEYVANLESLNVRGGR